MLGQRKIDKSNKNVGRVGKGNGRVNYNKDANPTRNPYVQKTNTRELDQGEDDPDRDQGVPKSWYEESSPGVNGDGSSPYWESNCVYDPIRQSWF